MTSQKSLRNEVCEILKTLRLPGMLEAYQKQWNNPSLAKLSFDERLYALLNHESETRYNKRQLRLLKESGLTMSMAKFEYLELNASRGINEGLINELKTCDWMLDDTHPSLLISGATGTGKTFLAQCFGHAACIASLSTLYIRMPQFVEQLIDASELKQAARFRNRVNKKKVLILDDFGMSSMPENVSRDLLSILNERDGIGTTIIASQLPIAQWHSTIKQAWDADAIIDRLLGSSYTIELKGGSRRMKQKNNR